MEYEPQQSFTQMKEGDIQTHGRSEIICKQVVFISYLWSNQELKQRTAMEGFISYMHNSPLDIFSFFFSSFAKQHLNNLGHIPSSSSFKQENICNKNKNVK